jgi:hypothetical protein
MAFAEDFSRQNFMAEFPMLSRALQHTLETPRGFAQIVKYRRLIDARRDFGPYHS